MRWLAGAMVYTVTLMNPVASRGDNGDLLMEFVVKKNSPANGTPQARSGHDDDAAGGSVNSGGGGGGGEGGVAAIVATDPHQQPSHFEWCS